MKHMIQILCLGVLVLSAPSLTIHADETNNLLPNAAFSGEQQAISNWVFSTWNLHDDPSTTGKVDGKVIVDTDGHRCLTISSSESLHSMQMWWQNQDVVCAGRRTYELTVYVKGTLKSGTAARPTIGIYFLDADGKWIGIQEISNAQSNSLPGDWQKVEGKVTAPENAAKMGIRIGVIFTDAQAEVFYKDPVLVQKTN